MEFSAYAAKETSALITRVLAESSETSLQRVEALRAAIDAASKALEAALAAAPSTDDDVAELVTRLTKAATADGDARLKRLSSEARKITDVLRADLGEQTREKEALAETLKEFRTQADAVRAELQEEKKRVQALKQNVADAHAAEKKLEAAKKDALAARDTQAAAMETAEAELDALRAEITAARAEAGRAEDQLQAAAAENGKLEDALSAANTLINAAQAEREKLEDTLGAADTIAQAARAEKEQLEDALSAANAIARSATTGKDQLEDALSAANTLAELARAEKEKVEEALATANGNVQAVEAKLNAMTTLFKTSTARVKALEREQDEHADALRELELRLESSSGPDAAPAVAASSLLDGLIGAFEALSSSGTIGEVLTTLVEQLVTEFPRVALFHVKGNRLEGAHQIGFDLTNDIGKVVIPMAMDMDSLLTRAVSSGRTERVSGEDLADMSGLPFGGSPASALAMPLVVNGESIAIVYADDSGQSRTDPGVSDDVSGRFAEALRQHAIALLMRLTLELKAQADLSTYAGSLVDEIEQMYQADVAAGKTGDELKKRLHANLDYARSIYANRVEFESPAAAALFDTQLTGMIDVHRDSGFGRDLASVRDWGTDGGARAAEAS